jgi:hypothetical protein
MSTPQQTDSDFAILTDYTVQSSLALLYELEESLNASQRALLALDVAATENCTREQVRLRRGLEALLRNPDSAATISLRENVRPELYQTSPQLDELRAAGKRVQHLARVQAALLRRSQQFLCVLANCVAGPGAGYGPPHQSGGFGKCHP